MGYILYLAADDAAKEIIKQAETEGNLLLYSTEEDGDRTELVESIVILIATKSATEKVQCEVEMLSAIK